MMEDLQDVGKTPTQIYNLIFSFESLPYYNYIDLWILSTMNCNGNMETIMIWLDISISGRLTKAISISNSNTYIDKQRQH